MHINLCFWQVPIISTSVGTGRALNKMKWDRKDGRKVALGSSDGKLYIYDIGDMATPRESEWTDLQRTITNLNAGGTIGIVEANSHESLRSSYR